MYHTHTATSYFATFQVESGDRIEFLVSGSEYGMLAEGDSGADLSGYPLFEFSTERVGGMKGVTVKRSGGLKISRENERIPRIEHRVHA